MSIAELAPLSRFLPRRPADDLRERRLRGVRPLVVDGGCDVRLRGGPHADLVRVSLLEWLPLSRAELAEHDRDGIARSSPSWLAALVRPPTIWPLEEAVALARILGREGLLEGVPFDRLQRHARGRVGDVHLTRVRARVARIAGQLPLPECPCTSADIAAACAPIASGDEECASIAAHALARYVLSRAVAREAAVLHLP